MRSPQLKILIVEDEVIIADNLKMAIEDMGYLAMGPATNCAGALSLMNAERPDLALVDTRLGSETCEPVLRRCAILGLPVIISSGHLEPPAFCEGYPLLSKPYSDAALAEMIMSVWRTCDRRPPSSSATKSGYQGGTGLPDEGCPGNYPRTT